MLFTIKTTSRPATDFQTAIIPLERQWKIKGGEDIIITDMVEG